MAETVELLVIGGVRRHGNSKSNGNPYDFATCIACKPIESGTFGQMTVEGAGLESWEIAMNNDALAQLRDIKLPAYVECVLENVPSRRNNGFETRIQGFGKVRPLGIVQAKAA